MKNIKKQEGFINEKIFIIPGKVSSEFSNHPLLENLYITDIGYFPNARYHYRKRKKGSEQNILIYCSEGKGYIIVNGQKKMIKESTVTIIPAFLPHIYSSDTREPWSIYWCHFNGKSADNYYIGSNYNNSKTNNLKELVSAKISLNKIPVITSFFDSIFSVLSRGYTVDNLIYSAQAFAHILTTIFYKNIDQEEENYLNNTITYMKENLNKRLTLKKLANLNKLSKSQFNNIFKEETGFSPIDYFIRLKIQQACKYLDLTELQIKEIAEKLGYEDPYYFSRIFKKIMGISPQSYRNIKKG